MSKSKNPIVIEKELLNKKSTKELLGYLKRLYKCEESYELSDMETNPDLTDFKTIYFKNTENGRLLIQM